MESSSLSASSKRAKAPGSINAQAAHCLVDGCNADLSACRDYHRRHKVCEIHSKTPKVTIGGREQRFCQQCSRFHSLVEFDEGKRSCRKRLDGHNRRRRKPQPDSLHRNSGLVFSPQQGGAAGGRLLSFSSPQIVPSSILSSSWTGVVKPETDRMLYDNQMNFIDRQNSIPDCSAQSYKGVNQLQFIQTCDYFDPNAASGSSSNNGRQMFSNIQVLDCDRALSLLSPAPPSSRESGLNQVAPPDEPVHNFHFCGLGHQYPFNQENKEVLSSTHSRASHSSALHAPGMFQNASEESSTATESDHQTLTFMWE